MSDAYLIRRPFAMSSILTCIRLPTLYYAAPEPVSCASFLCLVAAHSAALPSVCNGLSHDGYRTSLFLVIVTAGSVTSPLLFVLLYRSL